MIMRTSAVIPKIAAVAGALVLGTLLLSGCSASADSADQPAPSDAGEHYIGALKDQLTAIDAFEGQKMVYQQKLGSCLAKHGVKDASDADVSDSDRDAATSACTGEIGEAPQPSAEQATATRTVNQAILDCIAGKGHAMPDLDASGEVPKNVEDQLEKDPALEKDAKACGQDLLQ